MPNSYLKGGLRVLREHQGLVPKWAFGTNYQVGVLVGSLRPFLSTYVEAS